MKDDGGKPERGAPVISWLFLGFTGRDKMGGRLSCALVRCWEKEGGSMCKQGGRRLPRALQFVLQKSGEREEIGLG